MKMQMAFRRYVSVIEPSLYCGRDRSKKRQIFAHKFVANEFVTSMDLSTDHASNGANGRLSRAHSSDSGRLPKTFRNFKMILTLFQWRILKKKHWGNLVPNASR
jgi:hypothetical protein